MTELAMMSVCDGFSCGFHNREQSLQCFRSTRPLRMKKLDGQYDAMHVRSVRRKVLYHW